MRVYIIDDDARICRTITRMLVGAGVEAHAFEDAAGFLGALDDLDFGCVMLDIGMPGHNGLDVLEEISRQPLPMPVVMVSGSVAVDDAIASFRRGAIHFLRKPFRRDELLSALAEAGAIAAERMAAYNRQQLAGQVRLTVREREVLIAMAAGSQTKVIAWQLGLSVRTVDMHRSNILAKLGARNASQAVAIARSLDLVAEEKSAA